MERKLDDRKQDVAAGGVASIPEDMRQEVELLRRELERLRKTISSTSRRSAYTA